MPQRISNIVFTKNRPLQLDAYLTSLYRHVPEELIQTYVIYKVELFDEQYSEIFRRFDRCVVIREKDFHDDFVNLIEQIDTKYVLFATDDVVYFDSVDFAVVEETFGRFADDIFGFTFKFGADSLDEREDVVSEADLAGETVYRLNWKRAADRHARYPFELNSTVYKSELVKEIVSHTAKERPLLKRVFARDSLVVRILKRIVSMKRFLLAISTFHDPNTLEGYCYKWCRGNKSKVPDNLYFQRLCASAIQVNIVNTSVDNPIDGGNEHTVEVLNERYIQGYRFDIEAIEKNKPGALSLGQKYFSLVKNS